MLNLQARHDFKRYSLILCCCVQCYFYLVSNRSETTKEINQKQPISLSFFKKLIFNLFNFFLCVL